MSRVWRTVLAALWCTASDAAPGQRPGDTQNASPTPSIQYAPRLATHAPDTTSADAARARDTSRRPRIAYALRIESAHLEVADITLRIADAPDTVRLAMKVHPEYDARYWRFIDSMQIDGSADDRRARVLREDS